MLKNNSKTICSLGLLALSSSLYAGSMGPVSEAQGHALFADGEAAYTWNSIGSTIVRNQSIPSSDNGWGGRIGAGAVHYYSDKISFTGELGWGYYGKTSFTSTALGINTQAEIYGMDLLVGTDYRFNENFDLFLKLGGMLENVRLKRNTNSTNLISTSGATFGGVSKTVTTMGSVVPEIKVGGIYNFCDDWGVSLAYMYVFGNEDVSLNINPSVQHAAPTLVVNNNVTATSSPVALSTIMFGLHYKFA